MIPGLSGSLLSHDAISRAAAMAGQPHAAEAHREARRWHAVVAREMGPASSARAVYDRIAVPLCATLGFHIVPVAAASGRVFRAVLEARGSGVATLLSTEWGRDAGAAWRDSVLHGIGAGVRWCVCVTGPAMRIFDARRTYSRRFAQFDLGLVLNDPAAFAVLWWLLNADAFAAPETTLDRAVALSERYRADVRASLQDGVHDALMSLLGAFASARRANRSPRDPAALLDESLIVVYRILFLLFAEARGLVPGWHPTYRESYTIESLRTAVERLAKPPGLWQSLQAIARLAHRGCRAGTLQVPPFNGRLFSPAHAPLAESLELDDGAVREAMMALTTRTAAGGRQRIAYADLGVEQLGGVYERILDYEPVASRTNAPAITLVRAGRRKATGTFYTPRALTEFLVRRALAPLVTDADPDQILSLRVLDPAMGSGAFLVAACRYLAGAYESALIRAGSLTASDIGERERAAFRRTVAQRCLFGVDINPMAVQLGRLSLWLATLAGDRPLTFLDHHLRAGNSLLGASLDAVVRQAPGGGSRRARVAHLPLFDLESADAAMTATVGPRLSLARDPGDTIEQVRAKERLLASLQQNGGPLGTWKAVADLWCAEWFRQRNSRRGHATFGALVDELLGRGVLPRHVSAPLLDQAVAVARRERFFHWPLEFPEVFHDTHGHPLPAPGFDVVIGNPPWEMLRGERGTAGDSAALTSFARSSGVYTWQGDGQANLYQLFLERAIALTRTAGRVAIVLPSGFAIDHGGASLRRALLAQTEVDTFVSIENRDGLFPIHRGLKFLLITATRGRSTATLRCRFGVRAPDALDAVSDTGDSGAVALPRPLLEAFSGEQLAIPEVRSPVDLAILSRCAFSFPPLSSLEGWGVRFGRELNATDDREHFVEGNATSRHLPIVEGKQIQPFVVHLAASRCRIPSRAAARLLGADGPFTRPRLAYRDVASPTNRLTLIAAMIPAGVVTTHTLFCLKGDVDREIQWFLCGVFNSFVANYLVRTRVGTHVTVSMIDRLPVPMASVESVGFRRIGALSASLSADPSDAASAARLQAGVAHLYRLTALEFQHVLDTFPLISTTARAAAMLQFMSPREGDGEPHRP
jgi:hypothetical protein